MFFNIAKTTMFGISAAGVLPLSHQRNTAMTAIARTIVYGFLGGAVLLSSSAAHAAPYQRYLNGSCSALTCDINFPTVPAGKRVEITSVSCYLRTSYDHQFVSMQLLVIAANGNIANAVTLGPQVIELTSTPPSPESVRVANHTAFAFANAGQHFRAYTELREGSFRQFACHISGEILNAP